MCIRDRDSGYGFGVRIKKQKSKYISKYNWEWEKEVIFRGWLAINSAVEKAIKVRIMLIVV